MKNQFIKQSILFLIAIALMIFFASISDMSNYTTYFFVLLIPILFLASLFYIPLLAIYLIRKRKNGNIENVKKFFRGVNWFIIILLLLCAFIIIICVIYGSIDFFYNYILPKKGFRGGLLLLIKLPLLSYYKSIKHSLISDLEQVLYLIPYIFVPWLLYKVNKLNKNNKAD